MAGKKTGYEDKEKALQAGKWRTGLSNPDSSPQPTEAELANSEVRMSFAEIMRRRLRPQWLIDRIHELLDKLEGGN